MKKYFCDRCGSEMVDKYENKINIVDAFTVLNIPWVEGSRTYCELCDECRDNLKGELEAILRKYSETAEV